MGRPKSASKTGPTPRVTRGGVAKAAQKAKAAKAKAKATRRAKAKARETAAPAHVALRPALEAAEFRAGSKAPSTRRTRRGAERTVLDMLLVSPEGRAVWANVVAPLLGPINQALLARACRSGRDLRRAVAGDQPVGKLQARELLAHPDLIPLAEAGLGVGLYTWNFSRGIDENGAWYTYNDGVQWRTVQYPRWTRPDFSGWNLRRAMESAARWGCLDALKWMREHRHGSCCMDQYFMGKAAEGGQIAVLEWLIDNNLPFMNACVHAAENNHLEALEFR